MKKILSLSLAVIALFVTNLNGYTYKICYGGSDDPEVIAPDSVTVSSVINGGSVCWAPNFSVNIGKGEFKEINIIPGVRTNPDWNCHLVPETANGQSIRPAVGGGWPLFNLHGPSSTDIGETWQIKKSTPQIIRLPDFDLPEMRREPITFTIDWLAEVQEGIHDCKIFDDLVVKRAASIVTEAKSQELPVSENSTQPIVQHLPVQSSGLQQGLPIVSGESWLDWSKRMGIYALIGLVGYSFSRNMPGPLGNRIRALEGLIGSAGRAVGNYFYNPQENFALEIEQEDIMGGKSMGSLVQPKVVPQPIRLPTNAQPTPILGVVGTHRPTGVSVPVSMPSMSALSSGSSSAASSLSTGAAIIPPQHKEPVVLVRPEVHEGGELVHGGAFYWARPPTRREREAILSHIERLTEEAQTEETQPWIRRIRS